MRRCVKKTNAISIAILLILCILAMTACQSSGHRYNENPDVSRKYVGSDHGIIDRELPVSFDHLLVSATTVIIGEVLEDDILYTFDPFGSGTPNSEKIALLRNSGKGTIAKVKVLETIAGAKPSQEIVDYYQLGEPKNDLNQTKVKTGQKCVFILRYSENKKRYSSTSYEDGVFLLEENNKLTSMSDKPFCARYDGIDLDILIEDVNNSKNYKFINDD